MSIAGFQAELIPPEPGSRGSAQVRYIVTREQLADVLGLKPVTVHKLVGEGMPQLQRGRYDLCVCVQWYVETWRRRANEKAPADTNERKRYDAARASAAELALAERRREVVPIAEVRQVVTRAVGAMVSGLEAMPARLAPVLAPLDDPRQVQERLLEAVHDVRTDIGAALGDLADPAGRGRARRPAPKKDGRRVGRRKAKAAR